MTKWQETKAAAAKVAGAVGGAEWFRIDETTIGMVFVVDGVDFVATVQRAPKQRKRN